jgi:hypothetical protein
MVVRMSEEKSRRRKLVEFKSKQLLRLKQLEQRLIEKYPEKKERIESVVNDLAYYINYILRRDRVANYIHKILEYSREFPELVELVSEQEISQVLG